MLRNRLSTRVSGLLLIFMLLAGCGTTAAPSDKTAPAQVTINDMAGRKITIPSHVTRILALHPIPTYFLYRLTPDKVISKDMVFAKRYLDKDSVMAYAEPDRAKLSKLPTTGVFFKGLNPEQLLAMNPDVIVTLSKDPNIDELEHKVNIPVVAVSKDTMADYAASIRLIGKIVGNESEADKLINYWQKTLAKVKSKADAIPADKRVRVYFAGVGGNVLTTPGTQTIMASIVTMAGGVNVAQGLSGNPTDESLPVSFEQILKWNPAIIIVNTQKDKDQLLGDAAWKSIEAVKNNRVYVQPRYANLDGVTALMGLVWLEGKLYQNDAEFEVYFETKMREFYQLFHNYPITPAQIKEVAK
ncbi:MAG: ABC transporter substrate-binding protein [Desulfitobacteriaceae bacterium]|nr:ABC transporter substrate-binding protein [Desulfitobacteriaceae bacterium]MDI6879429.1 ABC transporter substrate-binding protein [Desulfitobacteriaceae bacterium]MDI6914707.1 ABC transporter substrate-binding protein [Desulfitobacteriaceae bacterium]